MPTDEECLIELYHTCKSILFKHGGDPEAAKKYIRQVFSAAGEKHCEETHEMFLKAIDLIHDLEKKKASSTPTDQSVALNAQNTAGTGRCGDYTTAPRQIQGGI